MKKKTWFWIVAVLMVIIAGGSFCVMHYSHHSSKTTTTSSQTERNLSVSSTSNAITTEESQTKQEKQEKQEAASKNTSSTTVMSTHSKKDNIHKEKEMTSETYDITKEVDTEGLTPADKQEAQKTTLTADWTVQNQHSIGNKHNLISVTDGQMNFTLMNRGKGSIPVTDVTMKSNKQAQHYNITLTWNHEHVSFTTTDEGYSWLKDQFK